MVALEDGAGLNVSEVGAMLLLGHADSDADVAGGNLGQVELLLRIGAVMVDVGRYSVAAQAGEDSVEAALAELFAIDDGIEQVLLLAAVLLVQPEAAIAVVAELFEYLMGDAAGLLPLEIVRHYFLVEELAKLGAPLLVLFGEGKQALGLEIIHFVLSFAL